MDNRILAALIVTIPISIAIYASVSEIGKFIKESQDPNYNDHLMVQKLQNTTLSQNKTINSIISFLQNSQIPFDQQLASKVQNLTLRH